ncbi:hypothetical protein [Sinomonas sp. G460-2]|uniref:hypothetical protein n=1 Tax=Sinomonas sp. G460-2 TaxID=3393464 RepID=UPI0039EEA6B4
MAESGNPVIEKDAFDRVVKMLYGLISAGDERIQLSISSTVVMSTPELSAYNPNGEYSTPDGRVNDVDGPFELWEAVEELRAACYRDGTGTWFSARITVTNTESATARYNYDEEPDFGLGGIDPIAYVTDQGKFPRGEEHQPEWLKQRLAEGQARISGQS